MAQELVIRAKKNKRENVKLLPSWKLMLFNSFLWQWMSAGKTWIRESFSEGLCCAWTVSGDYRCKIIKKADLFDHLTVC